MEFVVAQNCEKASSKDLKSTVSRQFCLLAKTGGRGTQLKL